MSFDTLKFYGSGAASNGGAQALPDSNLGNYRSSTELFSLEVFGAMDAIRIERVGELNDPSTASLESDGAGNVKFTADDSSDVSVWTALASAGADTVVPDATHAAKSIRVEKLGTVNPRQGVATLKFLDQYNNAFGMDNVVDAERSAGDSEYRLIYLRNISGSASVLCFIYLATIATIRAVYTGGYAASGGVTILINGLMSDWPDSGFVWNARTGEVLYYASKTATGIVVPAAGRDIWAEHGGGVAGLITDNLYPCPGQRIASETPSNLTTGFVQTIANEGVAPVGVTWVHPRETSTGIQVTLAAGEMVGIWFQRKIVAGSTASPCVQNRITVDHIEG